MKKIFLCLFAAASTLVLFSSCDKVDPPYKENTGVSAGGACTFPANTAPVYRKILVEDFTGHLCGDCPNANRNLYNVLKPLYGDTIITVAVHAGPPTFTGICPSENSYPPAAPVGSYAMDYRTPSGNSWFSDFSISGNPKGMISRIGYPAAELDWGAWGTAINSIKGTAPKMQLQILNTYNSSSGDLNTCIKTTFLVNMSDTFNLSVILTEDSIIDWQKDYAIPPPTQPYGQNDSAYVHRHVLRGTINSAYGEQIKSGSIAVGDTVVNSYSVNLLSLPSAINPHNPALNVAHCYIIAFVYEANSKEVMQVEEEKVE